jgi:hypothetical protein
MLFRLIDVQIISTLPLFLPAFSSLLGTQKKMVRENMGGGQFLKMEFAGELQNPLCKLTGLVIS